MRLADLDILVTAPPPPAWGGRYWIFVKLTTACGVTGWGEVYGNTVGPEAMRAVISDVFGRHMEGESAESVERMFRRAYSAGFSQRPDPTVMGAFSGLEIACWDILGKLRGRPVWALLGGKLNDRLRAYTYLYPGPHDDQAGFWTDPVAAGRAAASRVAEGFTAVKFDPAGPYTLRSAHQPAMSDIARSAAFCRAIRDPVGARAALRFGTHGHFTAPRPPAPPHVLRRTVPPSLRPPVASTPPARHDKPTAPRSPRCHPPRAGRPHPESPRAALLVRRCCHRLPPGP